MSVTEPHSPPFQAILLKLVQLGAVAGSLYVAWNLWGNAPPMRIAVVFGLVLCAWATYSILGGRADSPEHRGTDPQSGSSAGSERGKTGVAWL